MKLLITGGAGYIGSHMVKVAQSNNHEVIVLDNFSTGNEWAIKNCEVLKIDLLNHVELSSALKKINIDSVIHFAAKSLVGESAKKPSYYYMNNVVGTLNLLNSMKENDINNIVFSSTAAIFGLPQAKKIDERHLKNPINTYGQSKLIIESILKDFCKAYDFNATSFRYFNAAGADKSGCIGEFHQPETHLIPNILNSVLNNNTELSIFGNNFDTFDGTCVRDYVHVCDLADAHLLGLKHMLSNRGFHDFNLGNGDGFSVHEVLKSCETVTQKSIPFKIMDPREGDPAYLVSDSLKAETQLGWTPKYNNLDEIISTAWNWHKNNSDKIAL